MFVQNFVQKSQWTDPISLLLFFLIDVVGATLFKKA